MGAWTERQTERAGSFTIDAEALDAETTEQAEMAAFKRALTAPRNEPDAFRDRDGRSRSTLDVTRTFVAVASAAVLIICLVPLLMASAPLPLLIVGLLAGMIVPQLGVTYLFGKSRVRFAKSRAKFTLTVDEDGFVVEREGKGPSLRMELDAIERFDAQQRIALIDRDGRRTLLPLLLATPAENGALADRLNAATVEARARRGGYRGAGPRIATEEHVAPDEETSPREGTALRR